MTKGFEWAFLIWVMNDLTSKGDNGTALIVAVIIVVSAAIEMLRIPEEAPRAELIAFRGKKKQPRK